MRLTIDECCWLFNHLLEQRKAAWKEQRKTLTLYDQQKTFPGLKAERQSLATVHSQVLYDVAVRIDLAFKAFFRRCKAGTALGYPKFQAHWRYSSFCYPQSGWRIGENGTVTLSKIGDVKTVFHRPVCGTPKTCCIKRSSTGKWYVSFSCNEVPADRAPRSVKRVGIDVGLVNFATLSTGEQIANPRFFKRDQLSLAKASRRLEKDVPRNNRRRKHVARIHERIRNRRHDFIHQQSRRIVNRFALIAVEDLSINKMVHNHCIAKDIHDAAWGHFATALAVKSEGAGRSYVAVNPAYTSQDCSRCGHRQIMPPRERVYQCGCCGLNLDRDHNAALNILALGQQSLGSGPKSSRF